MRHSWAHIDLPTYLILDEPDFSMADTCVAFPVRAPRGKKAPGNLCILLAKAVAERYCMPAEPQVLCASGFAESWSRAIDRFEDVSPCSRMLGS